MIASGFADAASGLAAEEVGTFLLGALGIATGGALAGLAVLGAVYGITYLVENT